MLRDRQNDPELAKGALRSHGLRATSARLDVLTALARCDSPVTAQELTQRLDSPDADRVTVYRTLNTLVESGLAHRLDPGDRIFRFALAKPLSQTTQQTVTASQSGSHTHPHLVCDSCGTVECMDDAEVVVSRRSPSSRSRTATFKVKQQDVILHGTCGECEQSHEPSRAIKTKPRSTRPRR